MDKEYRYGDTEDARHGVLAHDPETKRYHDAYAAEGPARPQGYDEQDVFGAEGDHAIKYKTLSWWMVAGKCGRSSGNREAHITSVD